MAAERANAKAAANPGQPVRIYICGTPNYTGPFHLNGAISIYGGLSCDWKADASLT